METRAEAVAHGVAGCEARSDDFCSSWPPLVFELCSVQEGRSGVTSCFKSES